MNQHTHHAQDSYYLEEGIWSRGRNALVFIALISWVACIAGYFMDQTRFFQSYVFGFLFTVSIPMGAMFFVMIGYLTGSAWSVPMRRFAENIMVSIGAGVLLFIPIALGVDHIYQWTQPNVIGDSSKAFYLSPKFFVVRAAIYFLIWIVVSTRIYKNSTLQDKTKAVKQMHTISSWSAPGLLLTFLTVSLAAFDWNMSLNPHWYSTMYGIYFFAGGGLAFMATWTLICIGFRNKGVLKNTINIEHYHDLGKWMFALVIFWAYIAFSQYLLIWYANIPEETVWFQARREGSWAYWSLALVFVHFVIPFLALIFRASKRNLQMLTIMAIWLLVAHFVDIYFQVMPTFNKQGISLHWLDFASVFACASVFGLVFWSGLKKNALLPIGDPRFEQGLHFENI